MAPALWQESHAAAVRAGAPTYEDPATGLSVFTEVALRARGRCCESGCRHCPFRPPASDAETPLDGRA